MTNLNLEKKMHELKELKVFAKQISEEISALETELKEEMTDRKLEEMKLGEYIMRYAPVTSHRFDSKAFKKDFEDIYQEYCKPSVSMRFTLS